MSAGLPGLGLGGLFFILSALLAPLVELVRTARGHGRAAAWRQVGRQFAIAVTMIVVVDLALRGVLIAGAALGMGDAGSPGVIAVPMLPIGLATGLLLALLAAAKGLELALRLRTRLPGAAALGTAVRSVSRLRFESAFRELAEAKRSD